MGLHVLVAGGGVGGLTLAQGLARAGVRATVLERDPSAGLRGQGYRIHIDGHGDDALRRCLPEPLHRLYLATAHRPGGHRLAVLNHRFREVFAQELDPPDGDPARWPTAVNRLTLRQILLHGLPDVRFGHQVTGFEQDAGGVRVRLADGGEVAGDVLVGADGVGSVVRGGLLPAARVPDTGLRCVYGRTPLAGADVPERLFQGFTGVHGRRGRSMALAVFRARNPPEAAAVPGLALDPVPDYLMWAVVASQADTGPDAELWALDGLRALALRLTRGWHRSLRGLIEQADAGACFPVAVRTAEPVPAWRSCRVTVLGDAIHAMSPAGGVGANTALRDSALLAETLVAVDRGERELLPALAGYEARMREYGFAAVAASARRGWNSVRGG